jgi:hypothetical protein
LIDELVSLLTAGSLRTSIRKFIIEYNSKESKEIWLSWRLSRWSFWLYSFRLQSLYVKLELVVRIIDPESQRIYRSAVAIHLFWRKHFIIFKGKKISWNSSPRNSFLLSLVKGKIKNFFGLKIYHSFKCYASNYFLVAIFWITQCVSLKRIYFF